MLDSPPMLLYARHNNSELGFGPSIPNSFSSLEEARNSLDFQWNACLSHLEKHGNMERLAATKKHYRLFQRWSASFHTFLEQPTSKLNSRDLKAAAVLSISCRFAAIHFDKNMMAFSHEQLSWDKYRAEHEEIVSLAAKILEVPGSDTIASSKCAPSFSIDMNIISPLYSVAHRCRDPLIRRKAISLLYAAQRQEGIWNSVVTARVAERLMEIEEAGLGEIKSCEDVPRWARITSVHVDFDLQECRGTLEFCRQRSALEEVAEKITEVIEW